MGCGPSGLRPFAEAFELQEVVGKAGTIHGIFLFNPLVMTNIAIENGILWCFMGF
jgi:hypothetical protein